MSSKITKKSISKNYTITIMVYKRIKKLNDTKQQIKAIQNFHANKKRHYTLLVNVMFLNSSNATTAK